MQSAFGWIIGACIVAAFGLYIQQQKPECREGFTPVIGGYSGWYCAAGYKPK